MESTNHQKLFAKARDSGARCSWIFPVATGLIWCASPQDKFAMLRDISHVVLLLSRCSRLEAAHTRLCAQSACASTDPAEASVHMNHNDTYKRLPVRNDTPTIRRRHTDIIGNSIASMHNAKQLQCLLHEHAKPTSLHFTTNTAPQPHLNTQLSSFHTLSTTSAPTTLSNTQRYV